MSSNSHRAKGGEYLIQQMQKKLAGDGLVVVKVGEKCIIIPKKKLLKELTIHSNTLKQLEKMDDFEKNNEILKSETIRVLEEADMKEKWNEFPEAYRDIANRTLSNLIH